MGYSAVNVGRVRLFHLSALLVFWVGCSPAALAVFVVTHYLRLLAVAGGYHRYFSHRSFRTSRGFQFVMAALGTTAGQKGPLSWATSHRSHHQAADTPEDPHSPLHGGWFNAQLGWVLRKGALPTSPHLRQEFERYPEILFLNRHHHLGFALYLAFTTPLQVVVWGGVLSTWALPRR